MGHVPGSLPALVARARQQLAVGQCRVEVGEGRDLARRDATGDVDGLEVGRMVQSCGGGQLGQFVQCGPVKIHHALRLVRHDQRALAHRVLGGDPRGATVGVT